MKTPQEKAKELVDNIYLCMPFMDTKLTSCQEHPELIVKMEKLSSKQCALIAVDEIMQSTDAILYTPIKEYWEQVKQEIELL